MRKAVRHTYRPYISLLIFLLSFVLIDTAIGGLLNYLYKSSKSGIASQEYYIFNKTHEEVLIFGSSRAAFHYQSRLIEDSLGISVYNSGREGVGIFFHYALLLATLERYPPKAIILDLDFRDVYDRGGRFSEDVFYDLAPFYRQISPEFDRYITRKWYDPIRYQSKIFRYNTKLFNIVTANIINDNDFDQGYRPLWGTWDGKKKNLQDDSFQLSEKHLNTVDRFIERTTSAGITLVICVSPTFKDIEPHFYTYLNQLKSLDNVTVYDFSRDSNFLSQKPFFYDMEHLNDTGAAVYSAMVASRLKSIIKK